MMILLIEPKSHYDAPNLGLLYLCGAIKKSRHNALLLDCNSIFMQNPLQRILDLIDEWNIKNIGFSICDVMLGAPA